MHTIELLEEAIGAAQQLGATVRREWLDGGSGGICEFNGQYWLFVDESQSATEQLDQVVQALASVRALAYLQVSPQLQKLIQRRETAAA